MLNDLLQEHGTVGPIDLLNYPSMPPKKEFFKNESLSKEVEILKAIAYGRYMAREMVAISALHKYRAVKKRYRQDD